MEKNILNYKIQVSRIKKNNISNDFKVTVLSPSNDLENEENYKNYEKRLISALNEASVFNIAVTGIYGSGKSSILNTFKKQYKLSQWNFLDVSLSTFQNLRSNSQERTELSSEEMQLIERSILQQFFYSVPQSDIPLSRFKRITGNSKYKEIISYIIIVLLISSGLIIFDLFKIFENSVNLPKWAEGLSLIIFISTILVILYKIMQFSLNLTEVKLSFHDAEFNIKNDNEKSILNDHLDEILYFFESTKKNVVIIEDLDRFNNTEIFIRLRELNSLINKSCSHSVVFIYAIRDDMFEDNERSKFFDYIIPIIPIVNPTTAYDIVRRKYANVADELDSKFLLNTCLYFSDMRLVKNILNEYEVYFNQLEVLDIDRNKLFAMIVYKNYYPNDFAKLNANSGEIYKIFHRRKQELIDGIIAEKYQIISELEHKKNEILNESLNSIKELNSIYSYMILRRLDGIMQQSAYSRQSKINIIVNSENYSINDIASTEVLKEMAKHQAITLEVTNTNFSLNFNFSEIENEVDSDAPYLDRLSYIENKNNGELERLVNKESKIRDEIQSIKRKMLKNLISQADIITEKPLLKFFIANGYIDETYQSYISYFFEESISLNDKNYALLVSAFEEPDFELELKKCNELVENYLGIDKLSTHSALNFTMLDFLLTDSSKGLYLEKYIEIICDASDLSREFLKNYFNRDKNLYLLIPRIVRNRESIIDDINIYNNTEETRINLKKFIKYLPLSVYEELPYLTKQIKGELNIIRDYVGFILDCFDNSTDGFRKFTDTVKPVLKQATFSESQVKQLNWLGENNYLAINKHMIKQVLLNNLEDSSTVIADLKVKPLTLIVNSGIDYLTKNIWSNNLSEYIGVILLDVDEYTIFSEDEDVYVEALNKFNDRNLLVEKFIDTVSTKIKDINQVKDYSIQTYLIASLKVRSSWSNVFKYFSISYEDQDDQGSYREINSSLIRFLENGRSSLQMVNYTESDISDIDDWEGTKADFDKCLFLCNELSDEAYEKLIGITDNDWNDSSLENISQEKVKALISFGKLSLTPENWEQIKEYASKEVTLAFLVKHHQELIHNLHSVELRSEDIEAMLFSDRISIEGKQILAESKPVDLIASNENVRKKIIEIYESKSMPTYFYDQLLQFAETKELKKLLLKQIKYLDKHKVLKILELLDDPYQKLAKGEDVEFRNTEENKIILDALNKEQIVIKVPKAKKSRGSFTGEKVLTTRLQSHVLEN